MIFFYRDVYRSVIKLNLISTISNNYIILFRIVFVINDLTLTYDIGKRNSVYH